MDTERIAAQTGQETEQMFINKCNKCGKEFKSKVEDDMALCPECLDEDLAEMDAQMAEFSRKARASVREQAWRDRWEEGHNA